MSIPISGTLYDPFGNVARFADIKFVTLQGSGDVIESSSAVYRTDENGTYSIDVQLGRYAVYMRFNGNNGAYDKIQTITVNSDVVASTLGELLEYTEPLTPAEILIVQQLAAEAVAAKDDAQAAALQAAIDESLAAASASSAQASATAASNSVALLAPVAVNGGVWASGQQFTAYNQYMIYSGEAYSPLPATSLPYTVGATPNLSFVYQIVLNDHSKLANRNPADGSAHNDNDLNRIVSGVTRNLSDSLDDVVNIKDFGALDDSDGETGTNCWNAMQLIFNKFPDYKVNIHFPKTDTGKYYFNGSQFVSDVTGLYITADEGVEIYFDGTYFPLISKGVKVNREIKVRILSLSYNFYLGRKTYSKPSDDLFKMTQSMGDVYKPDSVNPSDGSMYFKRAQWPANSVVDDSQTTTSTTVNYGASAGEFNMALVDAKIGSEMQCYFDAGSYVGKVGVGVLTTNGYSITYQDHSGGVITSGTISGSGSLIQVAKNPTFSTDAYRAVRSLLGIRIHSRRSYSLLINGVDFFKIDDTGSDILSAGFVVGFAPAGTITLASPTIINNKKSSGVRPIKICCLGDSTSDPNVTPSAFDFMKQQLAGVAGIQVTLLTNLAVSGETSSQQLARLQAIDINGYDYLLCDVGINDIQGNLGANGLNANISDIIDIGNAAGAVTIVGLPTMWYESADAAPYGQVGQNTTNLNIGAQYRGALIQTISSKGALLNMSTMQDLGVADPSLLGNKTVDPVLMDNIHPTNFGRQLRGFGWAKSVVGHVMPSIIDKTDSVTIPDSFLTGDAGATSRPVFSIKNGVLSLSGSISLITITDGYEIIKMKEGTRPTTTKTMTCSTATSTGVPSGYCTIQIETTGSIKIYGAVVGVKFVYLDASYVL